MPICIARAPWVFCLSSGYRLGARGPGSSVAGKGTSWGSACAGTRPVSSPVRVEQCALGNVKHLFVTVGRHLTGHLHTCHRLPPSRIGGPSSREPGVGPAEDPCAQVSVNLRGGRVFDISERPLSSSLLISNGSFLPSHHHRQRSPPQSCLGEKV